MATVVNGNMLVYNADAVSDKLKAALEKHCAPGNHLALTGELFAEFCAYVRSVPVTVVLQDGPGLLVPGGPAGMGRN